MAMRAGLTGLFTTLLPCGWLYVFVASAGGTGSVRSAVWTMLVFWVGTVPALLAVGVGARTVLAPFRRRLPSFSAVVVLVMGLLSMSGHLTGGAMDHAMGSMTHAAAPASGEAPAPAEAPASAAHHH